MAWWFSQPKRRVPPPEPMVSHRSDNPMFGTRSAQQPQPTSDWSGWRHRILLIFAGIVVAGSAVAVVYGPWLDVNSISIKGTVAIEPGSLQRVTESILSQRRWGIIPNRNMWLLSSTWLQHTLVAIIQTRLSIEGIEVVKTYPHDLKITVHERIPAFRWQSGSQLATVDRHGVVMSLSIASQDAQLPLVIDQAAPILNVDKHVVKEEVTLALDALLPQLTSRHIDWSNALIPVPTCPTIAAPEPTTTFPTTTETNTNTPATNDNANLDINAPVANTNVSDTNLNTNTVIQVPCDLSALHASSQELHVQLKDGPIVYFDRHQDLNQAADALQVVLTRPNPTPIKTYIDLRFLPRVYTK